MSAGERLSYYAGHFPIVEADSTYYRPLQPELARTWAERAPAGFCFDIKAYGLLTGHPVEQASLWPDLKEELSEDARDKRRVYAHHLPADALDEAWARSISALGAAARQRAPGSVAFAIPALVRAQAVQPGRAGPLARPAIGHAGMRGVPVPGLAQRR